MGIASSRIPSSYRQRDGVWRLLAALVVLSAAACWPRAKTDGADDSHPVATQPQEYVHVFSGPYDAELGVRHYVAVRKPLLNDEAAVLDVLDPAKATKPESLVLAPTAFWRTTQVSPAGSEFALFVDRVDLTGRGMVRFFDISPEKPVERVVPHAKDASPYGIHFGATGAQMIYVSEIDPATNTGTLFYWTGEGEAKSLAQGVTPDVMLFSVARSTALIVSSYSPRQSIGALQLVDMVAGTTTLIDDHVVINARAFGKDGFVGAALASDSGNLAFSATPTLSSVAYTKLDSSNRPRVFRWPAEGDGQLFEDAARGLPANGIFPGISPSGKFVAYFEYLPTTDPVHSVAAQYLHVWSVEKGGDVYKVRLTNKPALCPKISADDRFIAFFVELGVGGASGTSSALGSLKMAPVKVPEGTNAADVVVPMGVNVDWGSVSFGSNIPSRATTSLTFLANLRDLGGKPTLMDAQGDIFAVSLERGFPEKFEEPIAQGIFPSDILTLPNTSGLAFEKGGALGVEEQMHPYVWVPGMMSARQLDRNERAGFTYKKHSLKTSAIVPSFSLLPAVRPDEVGYIALPPATAEQTAVGGVLRGVAIKAGGELVVDVDGAADRQSYRDFFFDPIGRVLGLLALENDPKAIVIWDVPFPTVQ